VTVGDTTPPSISCPADISVGTNPGQCSAVVNYALPAATDNCGAVTVKCEPPPGSTFPPATVPVTCTATDGAGNKTTCRFTVKVTDREAPVVRSLTATPTVLSPVNHQMVNVSVAVSASDNCGPVRSRITGVTSSDPGSGTSPADRSPEWQLTGQLNL